MRNLKLFTRNPFLHFTNPFRVYTFHYLRDTWTRKSSIALFLIQVGNIRDEDLPFLRDLETLLLLILNFSIRKCLPMLTWKAHWPFSLTIQENMGFLGGASGKEPTSQCLRLKRHGFDSWFWKILWRRKWQPTPEFSQRESHGQRTSVGYSP